MATVVPPAPFPNLPDRERMLRIGYLSGDFRSHPVGYFLEGVLACHDPDRYEIFAYSNHSGEDGVTARLRRNVRYWRQVDQLDDATVADTIRADRIDILVDLSGHTAGNRLSVLARRGAPVQATWIGYVNTTGLPSIDWIIADPVAIPPAHEQFYTERVVRLPGCHLHFTAAEAPPASNVPPMAQSGQVTFGCFGNLAKLNRSVLHAWARILAAVPNAVIVLKTRALGERAMANAMRARFAAAGGDAVRMVLEPHVTRAAYFRRIAEMDVILDTFPFNGGTTTAEAIHAGVPVLTVRGSGAIMSRNGETLLTNAGLGEWVATNVADYVNKAVRLANQPAAVAAGRAGARQARMGDPMRFTRGLEAAYRAMWHDWCLGQA